MAKMKSKVISHLRGDSKTWGKLSKEAKHEEKSDKKLIKKLKMKKTSKSCKKK